MSVNIFVSKLDMTPCSARSSLGSVSTTDSLSDTVSPRYLDPLDKLFDTTCQELSCAYIDAATATGKDLQRALLRAKHLNTKLDAILAIQSESFDPHTRGRHTTLAECNRLAAPPQMGSETWVLGGSRFGRSMGHVSISWGYRMVASQANSWLLGVMCDTVGDAVSTSPGDTVSSSVLPRRRRHTEVSQISCNSFSVPGAYGWLSNGACVIVNGAEVQGLGGYENKNTFGRTEVDITVSLCFRTGRLTLSIKNEKTGIEKKFYIKNLPVSGGELYRANVDMCGCGPAVRMVKIDAKLVD
eukprot:GDKI01040774.1.p1 GENE.GDKI01040774.1~~GDKI01040774.1.p1  ORF type:complete len:320 (-),score=68.89 GDKI01040774.1:68-964(-)